MSQSVMIKGNSIGFIIWLDPKKEFDELYGELKKKFEESANFFRFTKPIAVKFEGYALDHLQISQILDMITNTTSMQISYIMQDDITMETKFQQFLQAKAEEEAKAESQIEINGKEQFPADAGDGVFYRGTLRSGQTIESEASVVVLGDVNPGATVSAKGNIVVIGALKGYAYAGMNGNQKSVVVALEMNPMQIRIADKIARNADEEKTKKFLKKKKKKIEPQEAQIAFVEDGNIYIEPISKSLIQELMI